MTEMFFDRDVAEKFAEAEQNEKHKAVADVVDKIVMHEMQDFSGTLHVADLYAGAHTDRYSVLFDELLKTDGKIDWVDVSPVMIELAKGYLSKENLEDRFGVINFVEKDAFEYLVSVADDELNAVIMKYSLDYIENLDEFFEIVFRKLLPGGVLVATLTTTSAELKSSSTNARYLYKGEEFPLGETRILEEGEKFAIKFLKEPGNPEAGYIEGAVTEKFYYSKDWIISIAENYGFDIFVGDWKNYLSEEEQQGNGINQEVLVLKKKLK